MVFQTPAGGENVYGFKAGDACWFEGAEDEDGIALARTPAEVLEAGDKPVIRIDEPATHSLCTQWSRLQPLVGRGERCWHIVERGIGRGGVRKNRRVLVELQRAMPSPSVRSVNSEESRPATWGDLDPLSEADRRALRELGDISERELALVLASAAEKGCSLGEVRWKRQRNGELSGERVDAPVKRDAGSPVKAIRLGKLCATPGCTFVDFHDGLCSHQLDLPSRRRGGREPSAVCQPVQGGIGKGNRRQRKK